METDHCDGVWGKLTAAGCCIYLHTEAAWTLGVSVKVPAYSSLCKRSELSVLHPGLSNHRELLPLLGLSVY